MKIAATYDNGEIFQHFGRSEYFKVYTVEDGQIVSSEVLGADGSGHSALAGLLDNNGIDVLICGGIGGGAQQALASYGIELISGASGSADEAVAAYLRGELVSAGSTCDHHEHEEGHHCCGHHGEEGHVCCGHHKQQPQTKNGGRTCRVHYRGTFNDGTQFDSSYDRGEPLEFVCGAGMMIPGFDAAVADMDVGQSIDIHLMPEEAYGQPDPRNILTIEIAQMPGAEGLEVGQRVYLSGNMGQPIPVLVTAVENGNITFDANHEMAGRELNFHIELVEVKD